MDGILEEHESETFVFVVLTSIFIQLLNGVVNGVECTAEANKVPQNFARF